VTVEGIETEKQADFFAACELPLLAQGWYFGRPLPIAEFQLLLRVEDERAAAKADAG
jgi:sensor c-di-GMP phosphodiesterase-like protein